MRKILPVFGLIACLFYVSCQKELTDPSLSTPLDSTKTLRLVRMVDIDAANGDSQQIDIVYKDAERKIVFYENDTINPLVYFQYDNEGYLTEEVYYDLGSVIDTRHYYRRNANKELTEFEYDFFGKHIIPLSRNSIQGGYTITFKDTNSIHSTDKTIRFDQLGIVQEVTDNQAVLNGPPGNLSKKYYYYNSLNELTSILSRTDNVLDTNLILKDSTVSQIIYEQKKSSILNDFCRNVCGKDLQWSFSHPGSYVTVIKKFFHPDFVLFARPIKEIIVQTYKFENNVWIKDFLQKHIDENVFDSFGNLIEVKYSLEASGIGLVHLGTLKFYYKKI